MPDMEKVIKGLEVCTSIADGESCPKDCPYYQEVCYGYDQLMRDALALLKEQETVEHAKEVLCKNGWEKMRFPEGTIGKWDDPEIVRCKDCKHGEKCNEIYLCGKARGFGIAHDPSWFCADGEHK